MANRKTRLPHSKRSAPINRFLRFGNYTKIKSEVDSRLTKVEKFASRKPLTSFFIGLILLLLVIVAGSTIFKTSTPKEETVIVSKNVEIYTLDGKPTVNVQGKVSKNGVVTIVAQTSGIIFALPVSEGQEVKRGANLVNLSSNYLGANAASLQRQLAGLTYKNTKETYNIQKDLIQRQKDLANQQSNNSEELRKLTRQSIDESKSLINLNSDILTTVKSNIETLQNSSGDPQQILSLQQLQAQLQAGLNQLQSGVRSSEYQVNEDKAAVDLTRISKDIALKQIELQERALEMSIKAAGIQLQLANVQESLMFPSAPFAGTVQKVHVKIGDSVTPGTKLVTLSGYDGTTIVDAQVSQEMARKVSISEKAIIEVGDKKIEVVPFYVSTEATSGQLYSVLFCMPDEDSQYFTDNSYVSVSLPLANNQTLIPSIPVDSVFQTQNEAFVFVIKNNKAVSKKVKLGQVFGQFVIVESGLSQSDQIILNRTVVEGDTVKVINR